MPLQGFREAVLLRQRLPFPRQLRLRQLTFLAAQLPQAV